LFLSILATINHNFWSQASQKLILSISAIEIQNRYQGLILDTAGTATLLRNLMEGEEEIFITNIEINRGLKPILVRHYDTPTRLPHFLFNSKSFDIPNNGKQYKVRVSRADQIFFSYVVLSFLFAVAITLGIQLIEIIITRRNESLISDRIGQMALQVAHDIRAPLAALNAAYDLKLQDFQNSKDLIQRSVKQIRILADNLLDKCRPYQNSSITKLEPSGLLTPPPQTSESLQLIIENVILETQLRLKNQDFIQFTIHNTHPRHEIPAHIDNLELTRLLTNLVNNSIESIESTGRCDFNLRTSGPNFCIEIIDTGKGIKKEHLEKIGNTRFTHGKEKGNGLGLFHAIQTVKSWGGKLEITSELNIGTSIKIIFPNSIENNEESTFIDLKSIDDIVIYDPYNEYTKEVENIINSINRSGNLSKNLIKHSTTDELINWYRINIGDQKATQYLFFSKNKNDERLLLKLSQMLAIDNSLIVVTDYDNPDKHLSKSNNNLFTVVSLSTLQNNNFFRF